MKERKKSDEENLEVKGNENEEDRELTEEEKKEIDQSLKLTEKDKKELEKIVAEAEEIVADSKYELAEKNKKLAVFWAGKYSGSGVEFEELVQAGMEGLTKACLRFDPAKGKFGTYASYPIRSAIRNAIRKSKQKNVVSMQATVGEDDGDTELGELIADEKVKPVDMEAIVNVSDTTYSSKYEYVKAMKTEDSEDEYILKQLLEDVPHEVIRKNLGMDKAVFDEKITKLHRKAACSLEKGSEIGESPVDYEAIDARIKEESSLEDLPTGETTQLTDVQDKFNLIFSDYKKEEDKEDSKDEYNEEECWEFDKDKFSGSKEEATFLEIARNIRTVPRYKCIVRYLMDEYGVCMSESNLDVLWAVIEAADWKAKSSLKQKDIDNIMTKTNASQEDSAVFTKDEFGLLLNYLSIKLKEDYEKSGIKVIGAWTTYFKKLIYEMNAEKLDTVALALHMDVRYYLNFRKKVLKLREKDYLNPTFVFMFLTLKYAETCGEKNLKTAFDKLKNLYNDVSVLDVNLLSTFENTEVGRKIAEVLDDPGRKKTGKLKEEYKETLFAEKSEKLAAILEKTENLKDLNAVLAAIVLRYAKQAGLTDKKQAYGFLKKIYKGAENSDLKLVGNFEDSVALGEKLLLNLEEKEELQFRFRRKLFCERIDKLTEWFEQIDLLKNLEVVRSSEAVFKKLWKRVYLLIEEYEKAQINAMTRKAKGTGIENATDYKLDDHKIFRFLYGENVETAMPNRIKDIEDKEMAVIDPEYPESFLNSKEFLATRINDNKIRNFPKGENGERIQRNLLLTLVFLSYVQDPGNLSEDYYDRIEFFEYSAWDVLSSCGFMLVHSTNAYDTFLKLLLSCSEPMELFRYIWRVKTNSTI